MKDKEYHHYQFIDPTSGQVPLSITMLVNYHCGIKKFQEPINANDLIDINMEIARHKGNIKQIFNKHPK